MSKAKWFAVGKPSTVRNCQISQSGCAARILWKCNRHVNHSNCDVCSIQWHVTLIPFPWADCCQIVCIVLLVVATIFCVTGVALWIAVGVVVSNPPIGKLKSCYSSIVLYIYIIMSP